MCEEFNDAMEQANTNLYKLGDSINQLKIPCRYKGAFMVMADNRGFRFIDTKAILTVKGRLGKS